MIWSQERILEDMVEQFIAILLPTAKNWILCHKPDILEEAV